MGRFIVSFLCNAIILSFSTACAPSSSSKAAYPPALPVTDKPFIQFQKAGTILDRGPKGAFDSCHTKYPSIVKVDTILYMFYGGRTDDCITGAIGLATSIDDGVTWVKQGVVIPHGGINAPNAMKSDHPSVLYENGVFRMWFTMQDKNQHYSIGYAISPDGLFWTTYPPVLHHGQIDAFDSTDVLHPTVSRGPYGKFYMLYNGLGTEFRLGLASSEDGIHWVRENDGKSVINPSVLEGISERYTYNAQMTFNGLVFETWYSAVGPDILSGAPYSSCIVHAVSWNGISWVKDKAPTLCNGSGTDADSLAAFAPAFYINVANKLIMIYTQSKADKKYSMAMAVETL